jgi:F-type H+-transporting ATPase subunit gamma
MEMVAASKMRKSQLVALGSRPYAEKAIAVLGHIKAGQPDIKNIFLDGPTTSPPSPLLRKERGARGGKLLAVVVTSDKGLCGGLNSAVIRESQRLFEQYKKDGYEVELLLVGAKSKSYFERMGLKIHETFRGVGDYVTLEEVKPVAQFIQEKYKTEEFAKVIAIYTKFISTLKQRVEQRQILPITTTSLTLPPNPLSYSKRGGGFTDVLSRSPSLNVREGAGEESYRAQKARGGSKEYIFEPSPQAVLENLIPFLLGIYIYHIILESNASEHSARMVAMKNASDSAENILDELTLSYNKARQAAITNEIAEITAGVEALK